MLKRVLAIGGLGIVVLVAFLAFSFLRTPEEASGPIEAIPLEVVETEPAATEQTLAEAAPTEVPKAEPEVLEAPYPAEAQADAPYPVEDQSTNKAETPEEVTPTTEPSSEGGTSLFQIVQAESEARFIINEVLNGSPKTVIGVTDQVAAEIVVDFGNPTNSQVGTISINARGLATDNDFRNRAIKNRILDTNTYEFIFFAPKQITGMPDSVSFGESYTFQIVGDLNVREITQEVTFEVTVTTISETQIQGTASTTILYADYDIVIPEVTSVTGVEDEVRLEIDFLAETG